MKEDREAGVVIPFKQNAAFYFQRGNKYLADEDLPKAEQYLRKAYEMEPDRTEYMLTFAEALHRRSFGVARRRGGAAVRGAVRRRFEFHRA